MWLPLVGAYRGELANNAKPPPRWICQVHNGKLCKQKRLTTQCCFPTSKQDPKKKKDRTSRQYTLFLFMLLVPRHELKSISSLYNFMITCI